MHIRTFKHHLNFAIACALKRKRSQLARGQVMLTNGLVALLKNSYGITGRFKKTNLLDRLQLLRSLKVRDGEHKHVMLFEARVFTKRAVVVTQCDNEEITIQPPSYFSFRLASRLIVSAENGQ